MDEKEPPQNAMLHSPSGPAPSAPYAMVSSPGRSRPRIVVVAVEVWVEVDTFRHEDPSCQEALNCGLREREQWTRAWCALALGMDCLAELADGQSVGHDSVAVDVAPQLLVAA